jgi:hypothetical protein
MAALLSPLQLQAASGLFQNKGYQVNPGVTAAVAAYNAQPLIANLITAINAAGSLGNSTQANLQTFGTANCPALADSFNSTSTYPVTSTLANPGLTGIITLTADAYMGNGDLSKFAQTFTQANSYCLTTNIFIESAVNSNNYLGPTFTGMDNLVTAGLTEINRATQAMGDDLYNAGQYIDLGNLANYGTPLALIRQISRRAGTISFLIAPLIDAGVDERIVLGLNDPSVAVTDSVQKLMYEALTTVTGDDLAGILRILDVWTPNITSLADLLNPAIMLPNSYKSLTVPTAVGPRAIFIAPDPVNSLNTLTPADSKQLLEQETAARAIVRPLACELRQSENPVTAAASPVAEQGGTGSGAMYTVNSNLEARVAADQVGVSYERLSKMTSPGLALANKAYACSLGQVANISRMTLPQLSAAFLAVETNKDLPAIEAQTTPVPQADLNYYASNIAIGSGENGTILLTDILGTAAGTNITQNLSNCVTIMTELQSANAFYTLNGYYVDMQGNIANVTAIDNLIANARAEINVIVGLYPTQTSSLNTYFTAINTQLTREAELLTQAVIDIGNVQGNNQVAIMSFASSLPGYGLDTKVGGSAQYLEDVAEIATSTGQSTVATLREGRTTAGLNAAGVGTAANAVESTPTTPPPQATLIPSKYSEAQAQARVVY